MVPARDEFHAHLSRQHGGQQPAVPGFGRAGVARAWVHVAGLAVTVLVSIIHRPDWFPRWPGLKGVRDVINFGTFASGVFVANRLARGAPELTLGKISSLVDAGMYSRAAGVMEMFERLIGQAVEQVCLPYMARGVKETGSVVPNLSLTTTLVTGVGWPFVCFLGLCAFPVVRILYGTQWMAAVPVAQILSMALLAELMFRFASEALFSLGKAREANRLQFTRLGLRLAGLSLVVPFGLIGAASGFVCAAVLGTVVSQHALSTAAGYTWRHTWAACKSSLLVTFLACAPYAIVVALWTPAEHNYVRHAALGCILTATGWLLATRALRHPVWPEVTRVAASLGARVRGLRQI
jgi:O-antigen/teichoic acid export membrane protein